jgi:HlyD family secretion protein
MENGSRPQEIEQARAAFEAAEVDFRLASADLERMRKLYDAKDISAAEFDRFQTKMESSRARMQQTQESLNLAEEGPREERIHSARAQVERSRAAIQVAEAGRIEIRRMQQEIASRQADVEQAQADLAAIEKQLRDGEAHSPVSGVILVKSMEQGEVAAAGSVVATVGDLARPWLRTYVSETDLGRIRLGDRVDVRTDSFPDKTYEGRITFIASEAEYTPKQIQTQEERTKTVYRIKVELENPNFELKSNMPADGEILLGDSAS